MCWRGAWRGLAPVRKEHKMWQRGARRSTATVSAMRAGWWQCPLMCTANPLSAAVPSVSPACPWQDSHAEWAWGLSCARCVARRMAKDSACMEQEGEAVQGPATVDVG